MHLKRLNASKHYSVPKKENKFITTANPGAHRKNECIPLNVIIRDILKLAETTKEVKSILHDEKIKIDGTIKKEKKYNVGLMDVISIEEIDKTYRVVTIEGRLRVVEIKKEDAKQKLGKIINKMMIKGKKCQITLHDGRNIILSKPDYSVGDSLMISIPDQKIKDHFKLDKGYTVIITSGKHTGNIGKITKVDIIKTPEDTKVTVKVEDKEVTTYKRNIFVIGKDKPEITIDKNKIIR